MSTQSTFLVTGASRGLGLGFVKTFLQQPSTTVIAAVRDPSNASKSLLDLPKSSTSKLVIVKLDSSVTTDPAAAISLLKRDHGIKALDVVIANAGIAQSGARVTETSVDAMKDHFAVNTIAPVILLQAAKPLLEASNTGRPIFVSISSVIGTIGGMEMLDKIPSVQSPYGGSKAALNWFVRRLHFEEPWLTSFVFHPGVVATDLAAGSLEGTDMVMSDFKPITVEESVSKMSQTLQSATRDISGTFQNYDGTTLPW
ncbi:short-chain dehydrogenase reductase sdr [Stemphylium lycopersici]|uniref:Short-chain dehydrogenase n=1 Tax=Stemphylium lycopersici TaxID=183478 RepID=A0A364MRI4_STELY|nr:short-chain dehydrogenase reductase sdr [Stemphylium lycopersici]RAR00223.1 short-chain dehydrogenase [Stemphylium lycopersici]